MVDPTTLGGRIRKARSQSGLSPADLARVLGLKSTVQISLWETDQRKPGSRRLADIANAVGVTADWLLYGKGNGAGADSGRSGAFSAMLHGQAARVWLHEYRAELARLFGDEGKEEDAYGATIDLAERAFSAGGSHQDWTERDSLKVLKFARRRVRRLLGLED